MRTLFAEAMNMPPERRARLIAEVRANDEEEGRELANLLDASEQSTELLSAPPARFGEVFGSANAPRVFARGQVILDRFRIVRLLGFGGMGEVYEAEDSVLGRVALKTVRRDLAQSTDAWQRFERDVQVARGITTPYVCRVHDFFRFPDQADHASGFLTMEFLEGVVEWRPLCAINGSCFCRIPEDFLAGLIAFRVGSWCDGDFATVIRATRRFDARDLTVGYF